jgi:hypothetical protein
LGLFYDFIGELFGKTVFAKYDVGLDVGVAFFSQDFDDLSVGPFFAGRPLGNFDDHHVLRLRITCISGMDTYPGLHAGVTGNYYPAVVNADYGILTPLDDPYNMPGKPPVPSPFGDQGLDAVAVENVSFFKRRYEYIGKALLVGDNKAEAPLMALESAGDHFPRAGPFAGVMARTAFGRDGGLVAFFL